MINQLTLFYNLFNEAGTINYNRLTMFCHLIFSDILKEQGVRNIIHFKTTNPGFWKANNF